MDFSIDRSRAPMMAALLVSTAGAVIHNMLEFPGMSFGSPEMLSTIVPAVVVAAWWVIRPSLPAWWAITTWIALLLILGAVITVLPLPFLPFEPEQSLGHYASHVVFGVSQLPAAYLLSRLRPELVAS